MLPLRIRFNDIEVSPRDRILQGVEQEVEFWSDDPQPIDYSPGEKATLWEFFKTALFWRGKRLQTPVLVMDQFEEVYTLQPQRFRQVLAEELGHLVNGDVPHSVRERIDREKSSIRTHPRR